MPRRKISQEDKQRLIQAHLESQDYVQDYVQDYNHSWDKARNGLVYCTMKQKNFYVEVGTFPG